MCSTDLRIYQVERTRLLLIQDTIKELYNVTVIENDTVTSSKCRRNNVTSESPGTKMDNGFANEDHREQLSAVSTPGSASQAELLWTTLRFEGDVSEKEIDEAKSFSRIHLLPGSDYTTSAYQLENQQEFNMVLESSQNIQTSTMALMTFDPEYFEVTLQGSTNSVAAATSKVVMILDKLREQARTDSNISEDIDFRHDGHMFYGNLLLNNFVEVPSNSDSCQLSHVLNNGPDSTEVANLKLCTSRKNCSSPSDVIVSQHRGVFQSSSQSNWHPTKPEIDSDDIECDSTQSPVTSAPVKLISPSAFSAHMESEDEISCEEYILTDPRYHKKIEQALKLGYSEKQVMKALDKHGPECTLNDLLSELIKIGASDVDPSRSMSLSPESDAVFTNEAPEFEYCRRQRLNVIRSESGELSSFSSSAESHGSNVVDVSHSINLRDIIIDGSNVAMSHGKKAFSCKGIQIAVDWFRDRGHKNITAFVPQWRKETSRPDAPITDQEILSNLEKEGIVVFTPARRVKGRRVVCYDDRYVLKLAVETDGIVVSNDVYRDLVNEREDFRRVVEQRLLMYSFVNDRFMPPEDPLGRLGPTLDNFLRKVPAEPTPKPQDCPYGKKCTYGNKCRFYHPERGFTPQKLITETLKEQADLKLQERATRLSEIAEKGKRSKQKLSRTKSLIPWESQPSQATGGGAKNKQEKPVLTHSKSLVLPTKSSDYLNEPRRKLEEAELTAAMEKMSAQDNSSMQQFSKQFVSPDEASNISKTKSANRRSSPVLQKDAVMQPVTSGDNPQRSSYPLKSMSTNPSRASPSLLTVPNPEPPERYLSGHLYLAKKLSDESVESNFFSEHTSSPSSTRTSSPIVPVMKTLEQKQVPVVDPKNRQEGISGSITFPPPFLPSQFNQQQQKYSYQTGHHEFENIPHLSIFDQGVSQYSNRSDSTDISPAYKYESLDNAPFTDYMYQKINPHSPDSGLNTSCESLLSPYQNRLEYPLQVSKPYPLFRTEESLESPEHLNLRRAFSSIGNFKTAEDLHQKLGRRASGFSSSNFGEEQVMLKPPGVPALEKSAVYQFGESYNLNRQNSSSDPQMHTAGARELQDVLSPMFSPGDPARNFRDQYVSSSQHCQQHQQRQFENQQRQQQQQQDSFLLNSHLSKPRMNIWREPVGQQNLGHRPSVGTAVQGHYNAVQSPVPAHSTNHMSPFPATPNVMAAGTYSPSTHRYSHPVYPQQSPMMYQTQFDPPSTSMFSPARRQSFPSHPTYQQSPNTGYNNPPFGYTDHQQTMPTSQPPSMPFILPEDAPILPDDPRYTIYYHLSSIFGEQVVRRVMNVNTHECNPDLICKRIIKYKEDTGL